MVEVGARQTERGALSGEIDPGVRTESFTALVAHGIAMRDEHLQIEQFRVSLAEFRRNRLPSEALAPALAIHEFRE